MAIAVLSLGMATGCSTEFTAASCSTDEDCADGLVCELRDQAPVCVAAADATLRIGQSAPATGPNQALGVEMRRGIELAFNEVNEAGGVRGRQLELVFRDDQYEPSLAEMAARALTDAREETGTAPTCPTTLTPPVAGQMPVAMSKLNRGPDGVLAILGNVGTPTMVRAGPIAIETGTLFFGAFTGAATLLRDDKGGECSKYIFNVRGSYAQEARATVEYFNKKKAISQHTHFISFDQNDAFGQAGYDGLVAAYRAVVGEFPASADPTTPIARFRYMRNDDTSVPAQATLVQAYISDILEADPTSTVHTFGIMMTDTYGAGTSFINLMRRWQYMAEPQRSRVQLHFSNVSFVGPNALSENLVALGTYTTPQGPKSFTTDVVVSQVVPNYQSDTSEVVTDYKTLMADAGQTPSFTSLEGYIAGRVFAAGLLAHVGPFTPESLIGSFEALPDLSLGLGANAGFSGTNHQYSQSVWGTILQPDGSFKNLYFWSQGLNIQFYE